MMKTQISIDSIFRRQRFNNNVHSGSLSATTGFPGTSEQ
jgi:hypothetical protein